MKGDITLKILELIQVGGIITTDILDTISYYGYHETYRRMRGLKPRVLEKKLILEEPIKKMKERQKVSKLLHKLKKEGLIQKEKKSKISFWKLTKAGKHKLVKIKSNLKPYYKTKQSNEIKIILFDIPETKRKGRNWLREALKNLKFKMLQKSAWIGKTVLPEEFFNDLQRWNILSYVEIFAITKKGTVKQIN